MRSFVLIISLLFSTALFSSDINIFFTTPEKKESVILNALCDFIKSTEKTIDVAVFDLDNMKVAEALLFAKKNGARVRIVTDHDNIATPAIKKLAAEGIEIITDKRKPFMHNKFAVSDSKRVWTGSYNFTDNCTFKNNNNAVMFESENLAAVYREEFEEMFNDGIFGNRKDSSIFGIKGKDRYYSKIGNTDVNVFFSPEDNAEHIIVKMIEKAESRIDFLSFVFTSAPIAEALIKKMKTGVKVRGVYDGSGAKGTGSQYVKLVLEGADIRIRKGAGVMHNKVFIIDGKRVITGSYNFTKAASMKNDENIVVIGSYDAAEIFTAEFEKIYSKSSKK